MNNREKILKYMKRKTKVFSKYSDVPLYIKEDYDEIKGLDNNFIDKIWGKLLLREKETMSLFPQCILMELMKMKCTECHYGGRHGTCDRDTENDWEDIMDDMPKDQGPIEICISVLDELIKETQ